MSVRGSNSSPPYLLYRNSEEVNGIWFYKQEECDEMSALFDKITGAFGADAPQTGMSTEAMLASMGLGRGTTEPEPEPVPALQQTDERGGVLRRGRRWRHGAAPAVRLPASPRRSRGCAPRGGARARAKEGERQKKEKQVQQDTGGALAAAAAAAAMINSRARASGRRCKAREQ